MVTIPEPANPLAVDFRGLDLKDDNIFLVDMAFTDVPNRKDIYIWSGKSLKNGRAEDYILGYVYSEIVEQCGLYGSFPADWF